MTPAHEVGDVALEVSGNGEDFLTSHATFAYEEAVRVFQVLPSVVDASGNATVTVHGVHFPKSKELGCTFGSQQSEGLRVSSSMIRCAVPSEAKANVSVSILVDGQVSGVERAFVFIMPPPSVSEVKPSYGNSLGGTMVEVRGVNFVDTTGLRCVFDTRRVPAAFVNSNLVRCIAPAGLIGEIPVELEVSRSSVSQSRRMFISHEAEEVVVTTVLPSTGSRSGGSVVTVVGQHFMPGSHVCVFGESPGESEVVTTSVIECRVPPHAPGPVLVGIVDGSGQTSLTSVPFQYEEPPTVSGVVPESVEASARGTMFTVIGAHFTRSTRLACRAGDRESDGAEWLSSSMLRCVASLQTVGQQSIEVSMDGLEYHGNGTVLLRVVPAVDVKIVIPARGLQTGGISVDVFGTGFTDGMACVFGLKKGAAEVRDGRRLSCVVPANDATGPVEVRVMTAGGDISRSMVLFEYVDRAEVSGVYPSMGSVEGGSLLEVRGLHFAVTGDVTCR